MAILRMGGVVVGLDPYDTGEHINDIATRAELCALIVKDHGLLGKISNSTRSSLKFIIIMDDDSGNEKDTSLLSLSKLLAETRHDIDGGFYKPKAYDPATIIFTSGTTGAPKGIMYTHGQVCAACNSIVDTFSDVKEGSHLVCWLPLSNLFQRIVNFCAISWGASTYYVEKPREIVNHLSTINPYMFIAVPRFYEKLYRGLMDTVAQQPLWVRKLIDSAVSIGDTYARTIRREQKPALTLRILHTLVDSLILKRLRRSVGTNIHYMISGSAPSPVWLLERFHAMGILILEAYGLSENIIPMAINRIGAAKFGTVGKPMPGNDIKLASDGELLVRGPGVFSGYYNEVSTESLFTPDGYLPTGDYGEFDADGFIILTGRKSEIFKTSTGRRIAPAGIEDLIRRLPYVEHAVVLGAGRKYLIALLSIAVPTLNVRAEQHGLGPIDDTRELPGKLYDLVKADVANAVAPLPTYQRPVGLLLTLRPFTTNGGELTSNQKLRRKYIETKYQDKIKALYAKLDECNAGKSRTKSRSEETVVCAL